MARIMISNQIEVNIRDIPSALYERMRNDLTFHNPEYIRAERRGTNTHGKPKLIIMCRYDNSILIMPRGYGIKLQQRFKEFNEPLEYEENRLILPEVDFGSKIKLRDYQSAAVEALVRKKQGGVVAGCGAGKTMIMLETMARIKQPALWITHTQELVDQVIERAHNVFDITKKEIGVIGGGKCTIGDRLTVSLVQTLAKMDLDQIKYKFGAIFIDEAHHMAAKTFFHPIGQFPALYRIWASATPVRSDGLTEMIFAAGGPILHTVDQRKVPTIVPKLEVIETNFTSSIREYAPLINDLIHNQKRNLLIVDTIAQEAPGNYSLVLSDRLEHLEILIEMIKQKLPNLNIEILTGSMTKSARSDVMNRVRSRKVDILLATQLAREGLDIQHLDRLFLTTPKRSPSALQQECGRVMRPCEGKTGAKVFDFWDSRNPIIKAQFWPRRNVYRMIGMNWLPRRYQEELS